jgi:predicted DNA-binding protein (MmcQ/YjbR family)
MDTAWVRAVCRALPHTTEQVQWESTLVFKVGGKMYAVAHLEPARTFLSFKCSAEDFAELSELPGLIPAPYLARAQWVALEHEEALPPAQLREQLRRAHALIFAKLPTETRAELERRPGRKGRTP